MLPYLKEFEVSDFIPLVNLKIEDTTSNLYFYAEHGGGKTTLCDLIVFSLLREEINNREKDYFHARTNYWEQNPNITSKWIFSSDNEISIGHRITASHISTIVDNKPISRRDYNIRILSETRLSLEDLGKLFRVLYQITELDNHPFFSDEKFNRNIMKYLKEILVDEDAQERISILKKETSDLSSEIKQKKKEIEDLLSSSTLLDKFPDKEKTLEAKHIELQNIQKEIEFTDEKLVEIESKQKISDEALTDFNSKITDLSLKIARFNYEIEGLDKRIKKIDDGLFSFQNLYDSVKQEIEKSPLCKLCGNNILQEWKRESEGICPICGLSLPQREISARIEESIKIQKNELRKRRKKLEREIREIEIEKENFEKELRRYKDKLKRERKNRDELKELHKIQINKIQSLKKDQGQIQKENDLINSYLTIDVEEEYSKLAEEQEKLEKDHEIKIVKLKEFQKNSDRFTGFLDKVELEWEKLYKAYLGGSISINFQDQKVISNDQELSLKDISGAETHISSLLLKIALWNSLIHYKKAEKGLIIIDSPIVYSSSAIDRLWEIINGEESKNICFIITLPTGTEVKGDFNKLSATVQQTLDDFFRNLKKSELSS